MTARTIRYTLVAAALLATIASACGDTETTDSTAPLSANTVTVEDGKQDLAEFQIDGAGISAWASTQIEPTELDGVQVWRVQGRLSEEATTVAAQVATEATPAATLTQDGGFEVLLSDAQLVQVLDGERLLIDFAAASGSKTIMMTFRGQLADLGGSESLHIDRTLSPVQVGESVVFRADVLTRETMGAAQVQVFTHAEVQPKITNFAPNHWTLEWRASDVPSATRGARTVVVVRGETRQKLKRAVSIQIKLADLGITNDQPELIWPAADCHPGVKTCVGGLQPGGDTELCGDAYQVRACLAE